MREKAKVTIYTRPGCHLCDQAKEQMRQANCAELFELEEVNIETDPALLRRYGLHIPVIHINGSEAFKCRLTSTEFRNALKRGR
jgi:glutaredoxin